MPSREILWSASSLCFLFVCEYPKPVCMPFYRLKVQFLLSTVVVLFLEHCLSGWFCGMTFYFWALFSVILSLDNDLSTISGCMHYCSCRVSPSKTPVRPRPPRSPVHWMVICFSEPCCCWLSFRPHIYTYLYIETQNSMKVLVASLALSLLVSRARYRAFLYSRWFISSLFWGFLFIWT